jgi:hypothetical protein
LTIPPELSALLSAHDAATGGPPQGQDPGIVGPGAPQDQAPPPQDQGPPPEEDPVAILDRMIQDAQAFIATQQTDPVDSHTMSGVLQKLLDYKAKEQKDQENMMQGKVSPKAIARAYGSQ